MFNDCKKPFNSNWIMLFTFYIIGITVSEVYNYFFLSVHNIINLIVCIFLFIMACIVFIHQYVKYNKDV